MNRHLTTHDLTWFIEAERNKQLDLDPPYQRRSVWTRKDRQFFLDTVFRNYPSPAIFLHKEIDENGRPTYHVVDGKQRIQTILMFVTDKIRMAEDYGDVRLNSRKWSALKGDLDLRTRFWNYKFVVEELVFDNASVVNDVFDRINRNARKLTRQELRHAKYDGWFIKKVEQEAESAEWRQLGVVTVGREKRMSDTQFLSELMLLVLDQAIHGFNQDRLDDAYAEYDDISHDESTINEDDFQTRFLCAKTALRNLEAHDNLITTRFTSLAGLYSVWALIVLTPDLPNIDIVADRLRIVVDPATAANAEAPLYAEAKLYADNIRGATTDQGPRAARHDALVTAVKKTIA